jgi:hypothetical protein
LRLKAEKKGRQKILVMMMTKVRDHRMKWHPAGATCDLDLALSGTSIFAAAFGRNTLGLEGRTIRQ